MFYVLLIVFRMASGGHRTQGEHYHNQDIHLTVACLRARKSQLSPRDAYYQQVQPERCLLNPLDRKLHGMPKCNESSPYSSKYNNVKCSIQEDKRELKRRLQQIERHEAEAEAERQKRAEKWRQLVVKEEREERERKRKIQSLQKLIERETQRAHPRYHTDVNSARSLLHIPSSHKYSRKIPCCSFATNITEPEVVADVLNNVQEVCHTHEHQEVISPATPPQTEQSSLSITEETDSPDDITTAETDSPDDITSAETDSPDDITTAETDCPDDITTAEMDSSDDITTIEIDSPDATPDDITTVEIDSPDATPDDITTVEIDSPDATPDYITTVETDSPDDITTAATDIPDDITIAETDNHGKTTTAETDNHDDITTATVITELPQRTPVTTELQIQQTGVVVIKQPEVNEESEATLMVQITTDVTKIQQCHSKEVQTQDTTVSMAQPTATQHSESTIQFTTDSDTRSGPYDTKFWYHLCNTDGINKTPESMSTVFICCHSEYSCVILYLLLYS